MTTRSEAPARLVRGTLTIEGPEQDIYDLVSVAGGLLVSFHRETPTPPPRSRNKTGNRRTRGPARLFTPGQKFRCVTSSTVYGVTIGDPGVVISAVKETPFTSKYVVEMTDGARKGARMELPGSSMERVD